MIELNLTIIIAAVLVWFWFKSLVKQAAKTENGKKLGKAGTDLLDNTVGLVSVGTKGFEILVNDWNAGVEAYGIKSKVETVDLVEDAKHEAKLKIAESLRKRKAQLAELSLTPEEIEEAKRIYGIE